MADTVGFPDTDPVTGVPTLDGFTGLQDAGVITTEPAEAGYVNGSQITYSGGSGFPAAVFQGVTPAGANTINLSFFVRFDRTFDEQDVIVLAFRPSFAASTHDKNVHRIDIFPVGTNGAGPSNAPEDGAAGVPGIPSGVVYHIRPGHQEQKLECYEGVPEGPNPTPDTPRWRSIARPAGITVKVRSWQPPSAGTDEVAWSLEVAFPLNTATDDGRRWIDASAEFGLYFNVIRVGIGPQTVAGRYATEFTMLRGNYITGRFGVTTPIDPASYARAVIPSLLSPPGTNPALGVRFVNGDLGVGVRPASAAAWSAIGNVVSGIVDNRLVAQVENTDVPSAQDVTAEFRFANWGIGSNDFARWAKASGAAPNPSNPQTIPGGGRVELTSDWPANQVPDEYKPPNDHQCIWVQLNSAANVNFVQSSVRDNFQFAGLSDLRQRAEISGYQYPPPKGGATHHNLVLVVNTRQLVAQQRKPDGDDGPIGLRQVRPAAPAAGTEWIWIVHAYRDTGETVTINGQTYRLLDDSPGAFGYVAAHDTAGDELRWQLSGGGIKEVGPGIYTLQVPHEGTVTIDTHLEAGPPRRGCLPGIIARIVEAVRRLLGQSGS